MVYFRSFIGSYKINIGKIGFIGRLGCMGLHQLEAQPGSHPQRRLYNKLGSSIYAVMPSPLPPSPLQSDIQNPDESNNRSNGTDSSCSSLASPALVTSSSKTSNISASVATEFEQSSPLNGPYRTEFIQCILAFTWPCFTSLPTLPN